MPNMNELSAKWCRHYNGYAAYDKCRAGIAYDTVKTTTETTGNAVRTFALPCLNDAGAMPCPECERSDEPRPLGRPPSTRGTHAPRT